MNYTRKTLSSPVTFEGKGLHSGTPVTMTVHPGEAGIWFRLGSDRVQAVPENVSDTTRCTRLGPVSTIEHLMSALAGLEITDVEVELTASELPGMDGSSKLYVEALRECDFVDLGEATVPSLYRRIFLQEETCKVAVSKGSGHWRYEYNTGDRWPGLQVYETSAVIEDYADQIAPARTFALSEELPMIEKYGLGRGLDLDSAVILDESGYRNQARFDTEPVRHKLLDMIGDLYLAGIPIRMLSAVGERNGHTANVKVAQMLKQSLQG